MATGTDVTLPSEVSRLSSLIDEKVEAFAYEDSDIRKSALDATKLLFDLSSYLSICAAEVCPMRIYSAQMRDSVPGAHIRPPRLSNARYWPHDPFTSPGNGRRWERKREGSDSVPLNGATDAARRTLR